MHLVTQFYAAINLDKFGKMLVRNMTDGTDLLMSFKGIALGALIKKLKTSDWKSESMARTIV